jgi:hypothetical protein
MNKRYQEWLTLLENEESPFEKRYQASLLIAQEARFRKIEAIQIPRFYQALVNFWKSLGLWSADRYDETLFETRKELAGACWTLSLFLPEGRKFFKYFPHIAKVEGPHFYKKNELIRGALGCRNIGFSLYEFHWEYPIEGFGVKKNLISVIMDDNQKKPIFDWCEENHIIVFCNRCGLEITYEVSKNCPWRRRKYDIH